MLRSILKTPKEEKYSKHVYHLYVVRIKQRKKMIDYLQSKGISSGIHYPIPIHLQKAYKFMRLKKGSFPESEKAANEILSLPIYPEISNAQVKYVCSKIKDFIKTK